MRSEAYRLLHVLGLDDVRDELATSLPYGKQRRLEIARALATKPSLLLLDEPAAGMNPQETDELTDFIGKIRDDFHLTIFMIEHHMNLVMEISDRIYVLDFGKTIAEGVPEEIQNNPVVIEAYLGSQADETGSEGFAASAAKEAQKKKAEKEKAHMSEVEEASVDVEE